MVEYALNLDNIFSSLADATRRDILRQVYKKSLSVGQIAKHYKLTLAAVSKHLMVLQKSGLVVKQRRGKEQIVRLSPVALKDASDYLRHYEAVWNQRFDALDRLLKIQQSSVKGSPRLGDSIAGGPAFAGKIIK